MLIKKRMCYFKFVLVSLSVKVSSNDRFSSYKKGETTNKRLCGEKFGNYFSQWVCVPGVCDLPVISGDKGSSGFVGYYST